MTAARLEARRLEWEAERRFLNAERQRIETRLRELDEIIAIMFPECGWCNGIREPGEICACNAPEVANG